MNSIAASSSPSDLPLGPDHQKQLSYSCLFVVHPLDGTETELGVAAPMGAVASFCARPKHPPLQLLERKFFCSKRAEPYETSARFGSKGSSPNFSSGPMSA
jgi:hypothetical protein